MARSPANDFGYTLDWASHTVAASGSASQYNIKAPASVHVIPGSGGTMTCQVRLYPGSALVDIDVDTPTYTYADAQGFCMTLNSPVYEIVWTATTAAGVGVVACL